MNVKNINDNYDELEQYDYSDGEFLEKVIDKYSPLIGLFLIIFSKLENELNIVVAEYIHDGTHQPGFVVIEKMTTSNKIDLFYKLYLHNTVFKSPKYKDSLSKIKKDLETLNLFRNAVVHANWESLDSAGLVRTKIVVDEQGGNVKFKKVEVLPKIIRQKIKDAEKLTDKLIEFHETAFHVD